MTNLLWLYDLSDFWFCLIVVGATSFVGVAGLVPARILLKRYLYKTGHKNEVVSYFLAAIGVFYGITLGLIAIGSWEQFSDVQSNVSDEAAIAGSLYRDLSQFPEPARTRLHDELRQYIVATIEKSWPGMQRGENPREVTELLSRFTDHLGAFEPASAREQVLFAEVQRQLNRMTEMRRRRIEAIASNMPGAVWVMVYAGAFINIAICWLFMIDSFRLHALLVWKMSALIGLLLFVTLELDRPFRGDLSIGPDAFKLVHDDIMMAPDQVPRATARGDK
ncbi:DUF4239 domain-containing protein [Pendulispora brunnea]|uniref:DUF4239 domain-containing protein n=1 Tax=Pendulispora brunnea TaxID=2905690 RepID=A0ABZ2KB66_9BACT